MVNNWTERDYCNNCEWVAKGYQQLVLRHACPKCGTKLKYLPVRKKYERTLNPMSWFYYTWDIKKDFCD